MFLSDYEPSQSTQLSTDKRQFRLLIASLSHDKHNDTFNTISHITVEIMKMDIRDMIECLYCVFKNCMKIVSHQTLKQCTFGSCKC